MGVKHSPTMNYSLKLDNPVDFYSEINRTSHFLNFSERPDNVESVTDQEDRFQ